MNLARIGELNKLINSLYRTLKKLRDRVANLEQEVSKAGAAQERLEDAVRTARRRVEQLDALGVSRTFLEDITQPLLQRPDISGLGTLLKREISGAEEEIRKTNNRIWAADREKKQLEMEEP